MSLNLDDAKITAEVLTTALPYIQRYEDKLIVVKYGGNAMTDPELESSFARDIVLLKTVGLHPVVVHGGGPQLTEVTEKLGVPTQMIEGRRVTDARSIDATAMVLSSAAIKISQRSRAPRSAITTNETARSAAAAPTPISAATLMVRS